MLIMASLFLECGQYGLTQSVIDNAVQHVIRNGKRWGRYPMNLQKDMRRIIKLLKRSADGQGIYESPAYGEATPASVSGWNGQQITDLVAFYGNDFLEVVAIMEYWGLWQMQAEFMLKASIK